MLIGKWIKNFEGTHSVTEDGHIYRYSNGQAIEVAQVKHTQGYLYSTLTRNGVQTNVLVHRVLAEAFIPNPENKKYVNHIDGNKSNNDLSNLEWCTSRENCLHAYATGLNTHKRKIAQYTTDGTLIATYNSLTEAQEAVGKPGKKNIACCLRLDRCKTAYGYVWRYLNEESRPDESIKPTKV